MMVRGDYGDSRDNCGNIYTEISKGKGGGGGGVEDPYHNTK